MNRQYTTLICSVVLLVGCAKNRDREEFRQAYDSGDTSYANGTIEEAEAGQLRFRELSYHALRTNAKYVESRKTIWLSNIRLFSIYSEMDERDKAQVHLRESYEYSEGKEKGVTFEKYSEEIIEFVGILDDEIQPKWKTSNQSVQTTSANATAPDL